MSAYVIASLTFTDKERYRRYQARFGEVMHAFGGELLVADERPEVLEGDRPNKVIVMRFRDEAEARRFLTSDAYVSISEDRRAGAQARAVLVRSLRG
jgi:uncharacterized protein (DUF1330 family)